MENVFDEGGQLIQIARGDIKDRLEAVPLAPGELFWNESEDSEFRYEEGTLFVGGPDGNVDSQPIAIGGTRANNATVYRGTLNSTTRLVDLTTLRKNDLYLWVEDGEEEFSDYKRNDLIIFTNVELNPDGRVKSDSVRHIRLACSSSIARNVEFSNDGNTWNGFLPGHENVQDALLELDYRKLQYCGTINRQEDIPNKPVIGGLYLITKDEINFNQEEKENILSQYELTFSPKKGDFVYWKQPITKNDNGKTIIESKIGYWVRIPCGYTDAKDIDFIDNTNITKANEIVQELNDFNFKQQHIDQFLESKGNVFDMLKFLTVNKAQLDENGKVTISQLPGTVLGAMQFRGKWNPIKDNYSSEAIKTDGNTMYFEGEDNNTYLNPLPGNKSYQLGDALNRDEESNSPNPGDYYIIELPSTITRFKYNGWTINTGDWIVYADYSAEDKTSVGMTGHTPEGFWSVVDNSDQFSGLAFQTNATLDNNWVADTDVEDLVLVGVPKIVASNKVRLINDHENTIRIAGENLVSQKLNETSKTRFYPRYVNDNAELVNGFIEDVVGTENTLDNITTDNITRFHSNVEVGTENMRRDTTIYGDVIIAPHIESSTDKNIPSALEFKVNQGGDFSIVKLFANKGNYDDNQVSNAEIFLPNRDSVLVGTSVITSGKIVKATNSDFIEDSSLEEFGENDNVVVRAGNAFASNKINTYEMIFGEAGSIDNAENFADGKLSTINTLLKIHPNLSSNTSISLPLGSGTLLTEEVLRDIISSVSKNRLAMGGTSTVSNNGLSSEIPTLKDSPIREVSNFLEKRLLSKNGELSEAQLNAVKNIYSRVFGKELELTDEGTYEIADVDATSDNPTTTLIDNNVLVGEFNDDGSIKVTKSLVATGSLGVSNNNGTFIINSQRSNFPNAVQYKKVDGTATEVVDVILDAPNESGVIITNKSRISGGVWR